MLNNIIAIHPVNNFVIGARMRHANRLRTMKRKPLSDDDLAAAQALRKLWDERKKRLKLTQEGAAERLGFTTQGAVSHYLNGYTPLNTDAVFKFAALLEVPPSSIRPDIDDLIGHAAHTGLSQVGREFVSWLTEQYNADRLNDADLLVLRGRAEAMADARAKPQPYKTYSATDLRTKQAPFAGSDRRQKMADDHE
ncbi:MAG: helix-turn-helix transcriptional regulator [Sphingobium sp.]